MNIDILRNIPNFPCYGEHFLILHDGIRYAFAHVTTEWLENTDLTKVKSIEWATSQEWAESTMLTTMEKSRIDDFIPPLLNGQLVAERLNQVEWRGSTKWNRNMVNEYVKRKQLPSPDTTIGKGNLWLKSTIEAFLNPSSPE